MYEDFGFGTTMTKITEENISKEKNICRILGCTLKRRKSIRF